MHTLWPYSIRLLDSAGSPVSDARHPGPIEQTKRAAQRALRERPEYRAVEICKVGLTPAGNSAVAGRVAMFTSDDLRGTP